MSIHVEAGQGPLFIIYLVILCVIWVMVVYSYCLEAKKRCR